MTDQKAGKRPKKSRYLVRSLLGLGVLWVGFTAVSWVLGRQAIERYCTGLEPGTGIVAARERALEVGLRFQERFGIPGEENTAFVTSSEVFGRCVCEVRHDDAVFGLRL